MTLATTVALSVVRGPVAVASRARSRSSPTRTSPLALVVARKTPMVGVTAYRYPPAGPPKPTRPPAVADLVRELRNRTRGDDGAAWDVMVLKIHRDTAQLAVDFVSGADADVWRITPTNIDNLPELARPRPSDFGTA